MSSGPPTYKIRANSNRVVKVDIFPTGKPHDIVVRTRSRNFSDPEYHLFSRRPSILTLLAITMILILVELQLIFYMKDRSTRTVVLKTTSSPNEGAAGQIECSYVWSELRCSENCCLRKYERKGSPIAICEPCQGYAIRQPVVSSFQAPRLQVVAGTTSAENSETNLVATTLNESKDTTEQPQQALEQIPQKPQLQEQPRSPSRARIILLRGSLDASDDGEKEEEDYEDEESQQIFPFFRSEIFKARLNSKLPKDLPGRIPNVTAVV